MKHRPVAVGLLLCEQVIVEERTRNVTPVNCFTQRALKTFPGSFPFVLFSILTDGLGDIALRIQIHRLDSLDDVYRTGVTAHFGDRMHNVRCILRISDCWFPQAGHYDVVLLADGEHIAQRRLFVSEELA